MLQVYVDNIISQFNLKPGPFYYYYQFSHFTRAHGRPIDRSLALSLPLGDRFSFMLLVTDRILLVIFNFLGMVDWLYRQYERMVEIALSFKSY